MLNIRQSLINFYIEHSSLLGTYCEACRESATKGSVHKLRVALKNLKGLVVLLNDIDQDQDKKKGELPSDLKKLFRVTGNLRDLQVLEAELVLQENELGTKFNSIRNTLRVEQHKRAEEVARILEELTYWTETAYIETYLYKVVDSFPDERMMAEKITVCLQRSWKKIQSLLAKEHTEENLHRIRIRNRNLNAVLSVVTEGNCLTGLLPFNPQDLVLFQRLLGKWHDVAVFRGKVKKYAEGLDENNRQVNKLALLQSSLTLKQHRMKRRITRFIKRFETT